MNTWQLLRQLRSVLLARTWEGGANKVFASRSVIATAGITDEKALAKLRTPILLLFVGPATPDKDQPNLLRQIVMGRLIVSVRGGAGGGLGDRPLLGSNPIATDQSEGRGLLEVEEEVLGAVENVGKASGIQILNRALSGVAPTVLDGRDYAAVKDYEFEAWVTSARFYPPARSLQLTDLTAGQARIDWKNPPARFDRFNWQIRRLSGSTAPALPTDGTQVSTNTNFAIETFTDTPTAGTFSYSVFIGYDDLRDPPSAERRFSAPVSGTIVVT